MYWSNLDQYISHLLMGYVYILYMSNNWATQQITRNVPNEAYIYKKIICKHPLLITRIKIKSFIILFDAITNVTQAYIYLKHGHIPKKCNLVQIMKHYKSRYCLHCKNKLLLFERYLCNTCNICEHDGCNRHLISKYWFSDISNKFCNKHCK